MEEKKKKMTIMEFVDAYGSYIELGILVASVYMFGQIVGVYKVVSKHVK